MIVYRSPPVKCDLHVACCLASAGIVASHPCTKPADLQVLDCSGLLVIAGMQLSLMLTVLCAARPRVKASQCFTKYKFRDEKAAEAAGGPAIVATQVNRMHL